MTPEPLDALIITSNGGEFALIRYDPKITIKPVVFIPRNYITEYYV
jgi:hypothetical protein